MRRYLRSLPSLAIVALIVLLGRTNPQSLAQSPVGLDCPLGYCIEALSLDPLQSQDPLTLVQRVTEGCAFRELSLPIEPISLTATYEVSLHYVVPETGDALSTTYAIFTERRTIRDTDPFAPIHDPRRSVGHEQAPWLSYSSGNPRTTVAVRADVQRTARVYLDPTLVGSAPPTLTYGTHGPLDGIFAIQTCSTTPNRPRDKEFVLDRYISIFSAANYDYRNTLGLIWTVNLPATSNLSMLELALPHPGATDGSLVVEIIDPGDLERPLTWTQELGGLPVLGTFELASGTPGAVASWMPALAVDGPVQLEANRTYWMHMRTSLDWELAADSGAAGSGHSGSLYRAGINRSGWDEMLADLPFVLVGTTSANPSAVQIGDPRRALTVAATPSPFSYRTEIRWQGNGDAAAVEVYDVRGRRVRSLKSAMHDGRGQVVWDGCNDTGDRLPKGTYLVRVRSGSGQFNTCKVVLLH